jgi:hypothetical protein
MTSEKCWICGEAATTAEHKNKRSDLKLMSQGIGFKKGGRLIKILNNGKKSIIQGLDSKEVKYKKISVVTAITLLLKIMNWDESIMI